jgi:serine/threonine-protein kinase
VGRGGTVTDELSDQHELIGQTLAGKYALQAPIGGGGMGWVYRAQQLPLDRTVAVKVLKPQISQQPAYVERFRREALAASRLDHPHSVRVLDFGEDGGRLYLVMEHVQGRTLADIIDEEFPFEAPRIVDLLSQVLSALAVAHALGIVHRDLKPENILVARSTGEDGRPVEIAKVCDFGIAKLGGPRGTGSRDPGRITSAGTVVGTPDYLSPEQSRAEALDGRSDLYTVGIVLFHMLAGRVPFEAATPLAVLHMHGTRPPPRPSTFAPVLPALEEICLKAIAKPRHDRFQSAQDMRAALRAAIDPRPRARARTTRLDLTRLVRARPTASLGVLVAVALFFIWFQPWRSSARPPASPQPLSALPAEPAPTPRAAPPPQGPPLEAVGPQPERPRPRPHARRTSGRLARRHLDEDGVLPPSLFSVSDLR